MRALVVLAVVGVCTAVPFVQDTPEVAAEKARFFQAYQAAQAAAQPQYNAIPHQAYNTGHYNPSHHNLGHYNHAPAQPKWTGPVAATIPAGLPGAGNQVADTPEVAAARQAFFSTYQRQAAAAAPPTLYY
ncbi:cuticle protein CP1499-like [Homarus americanus]|uniref:Cuticle protein n=1 Tax=Homarus americanus TaxID=6706 RepID=A0A8J5TK62_HOMAM|nr:cuticle protein CP1499-like [Homarus americanus]KAG7177134.1 Cuticle protein [Homarus americanus]